MFLACDGCSRRSEALKPTETFNPTLQRFYQWLAARSLTPGCPIPPIDGVVKKWVKPLPAIVAVCSSCDCCPRAVDPDEALFAAAAPQLTAFKAAFGLNPNGIALLQCAHVQMVCVLIVLRPSTHASCREGACEDAQVLG